MSRTLASFNEQQLPAVTSEAKTILCLAGAGSGKTRVLTGRIAYLHQEKRVGTAHMVALTFTRYAAQEMKKRLEGQIPRSEIRKMFIGTIHSWAYRMICRDPIFVGLREGFSIYDEDDRKSVIKSVIEDFRLKHTSVAKVLAGQSDPDAKVWSDTIRAREEYHRRLLENNATDLDTIIKHACKIMSNKDKAQDYRERYTHVFVDEYQDTSLEQNQLLASWSPENLFVVGDDYQAIYGWRGAEVDNIVKFGPQTGMPVPEVHKLEVNYRSSIGIVEAANALISHNINQTEKDLRAASSQKSGLTYWTFNIEQERQWGEDLDQEQMQTIKYAQLLDKAGQAGDLAVLCRTNKTALSIFQALQGAGLPVVLIGGDYNALNNHEARGLLAYLQAAYNPRDRFAMTKALCFPEFPTLPGGGSFHKIEEYALWNQVNLAEALRVLYPAAARPAEILDWLGERIWTMDAAELLYALADQVDLEKVYTSAGLFDSRMERIRAALKWVEAWENRQVENDNSPSGFNLLEWISQKDMQDKLATEAHADKVKVMTVHASKGLEFPRVILPDLRQGVFPGRRADPEEERRVMYVAITRAQKHLVMSAGVNPGEPSQYIAETQERGRR